MLRASRPLAPMCVHWSFRGLPAFPDDARAAPISRVSIAELKLSLVGDHYRKANELSYKSYVNCGAKDPRVFWSLPNGEFDILQVSFKLRS